MLRSSLDHPKVLDQLLRAHPAAVHAQSHGGETLLQYAVRKKSEAVVRRLLATDCRIGLLPDHNGCRVGVPRRLPPFRRVADAGTRR